TAVFELAEAVGDGQATRLTVRLQHQHWDPSYVIGRFRLSVSADLVTLDRERKRLPLLRITEPWAKLAVAYHLLGDQPALGRLLKHHPAAVSGIGDLFAENQDWEAAVAEYSRAITPAGRDADLFVQRAEALEKLQRWEKAIADWGKADEVAADKSRRYQGRPSLVRRAQLYDRLRHYEKALADYNRALETLDVGLDPLIWRAAHWTDQGR